MNKRGLEIKYVIIFILALAFLLAILLTEFPQLRKLSDLTDKQIENVGEDLDLPLGSLGFVAFVSRKLMAKLFKVEKNYISHG